MSTCQCRQTSVCASVGVCVCCACLCVCVCVCECGWRSTSQSKACRAEANKQNALIRKFHYTKSNACQLYTHTHIHTQSVTHSHSHTGKCKYNQWQCKQINAQRPASCIFPLPLRQFIKMPQPPRRSSTCPCHAHSPCGPVIEPSPALLFLLVLSLPQLQLANYEKRNLITTANEQMQLAAHAAAYNMQQLATCSVRCVCVLCLPRVCVKFYGPKAHSK